jgi:hypothetical protein
LFSLNFRRGPIQRVPVKLVTDGVLHHHLHAVTSTYQDHKHVKITNVTMLKDVSISLPVQILFEMIMLLKHWFKQVKSWNSDLNSLLPLTSSSTSRLETYCRRQQFCTKDVKDLNDDIICRYYTISCYNYSTVVIVLSYLVYDRENDRPYNSPIMNVSICKYRGFECEGALNLKGQKEFALMLHVLKECAREELESRQQQHKQTPLQFSHVHETEKINGEVRRLLNNSECKKCKQKLHCKPLVSRTTVDLTSNNNNNNTSELDDQGSVDVNCCFMCGKSFSDEVCLKSHLTHTLCVKRFKCVHCKSQFKHKFSLNAHVRRVHRVDSTVSDTSSELSTVL